MSESQEHAPIDKSEWNDGPWQSEPDRKEWRHAGFPCLLVRQENHGAWCGYVGVSPGHPWHGKGYDEVHALDDGIEVHGGLTYASACHGKVCHAPAAGESDDVWWLGFDCAHAFDLCPARNQEMMVFGEGMGYEYRTIKYATAQCEELAKRALFSSITPPPPDAAADDADAPGPS